ncbi:cysteine peptidase family C39 domain-containing protein [Ktedonobacter robiniae]|uniref:Peptidase C39 domain-containing protein n=1 Tax=Ktedonobacter robiniae TaxID=2778365 RepID=A0ABQ3UVL9_9CHLR|nr:cysteine peptidase family C39 domain-containing protein [Ktedonobacter robiniae]GHO56715.1 hypothetical protein KSB_51900 [Ktedonobacter robiniae]
MRDLAKNVLLLLLLACVLFVFWGYVRATPSAQTHAQSPSATVTQADIHPAEESRHLIRVNQWDVSQYANQQEYDDWHLSTCSSAALTVVINYYTGQAYRLTDILHAQLAVKAISAQLGLLDEDGITRTAARFGLGTATSHVRTLDELIALAQQGEPSIVSFPPPAFDGGHIIVLAGGDTQNVRLVDSSRLNIQIMDRATFLKDWRGFSAILQKSA